MTTTDQVIEKVNNMSIHTKEELNICYQCGYNRFKTIQKRKKWMCRNCGYVQEMATKSTNAILPDIILSDIQEAVKLIKPFPIKRIDASQEIFDALKTVADNKVGNLYGMEIHIDPALKPNQYRIVK